MSLIARHFEAAGLPTLILGSALDILQAGQPPRVKFVNYPLGFESGRFKNVPEQQAIIANALRGFDEMKQPTIDVLENEWPEGWAMVNERERNTLDHRSERTTTPQYQNVQDQIAADRD